jgi:hypothetical protein
MAHCHSHSEAGGTRRMVNVLFASRFDSDAVLRYRMGWLTYMADG